MGKTIQDGIFYTTSSQQNSRECCDLETDEDTDKDLPSEASEMSNVMFQPVEIKGKLEIKNPQTCHKHQQQPTTPLAKRPPHCSKCFHPTQGHGKQDKADYCPICPDHICTRSNNINCLCDWHTASEGSSPQTSTPEVAFSGSVPGYPYQACPTRDSTVSESEHATIPKDQSALPTSTQSSSTSTNQITVVKKSSSGNN